MLTKEYISEVKREGNGAMTSLVSSIINDEKNILFLLNNLGRLPENFKVDPIVKTKNHLY